MEKETNLVPPLLIAVFLVVAFGVVGSFDYAEALTQDAIRKDPPKILAYSIQQDSPGLKYDNQLPLTSPVDPAYVLKTAAPKKHRRSTMEKR